GLLAIDHLAMALPPEGLNASLLFLRAVLGLQPRGVLEVPDPYGLIRSRALVNESRSVRITLNVAQGRNTVMARSLSNLSGYGLHPVALSCADIFTTVPCLIAAGVRFLPIPDNYYLDLAARFGLTDEFLERLRAHAILYER